jgi:antitoxin (DNA-binding transcriptional repressor) of toxin-antitoxin stability system
MATMSVSEARATLAELLMRVEAGEEVTITWHGRAAAVLIRPDALPSRRVHQPPAAAKSERPAGTGLTEARAEELIAAIRAGRNTR